MPIFIFHTYLLYIFFVSITHSHSQKGTTLITLTHTHTHTHTHTYMQWFHTDLFSTFFNHISLISKVFRQISVWYVCIYHLNPTILCYLHKLWFLIYAKSNLYYHFSTLEYFNFIPNQPTLPCFRLFSSVFHTLIHNLYDSSIIFSFILYISPFHTLCFI